jgi:hypothetical protein
MPTTYKVLGQVYPSASTNTTLYTVPSTTQTVVSTIAVCNQSSTNDTVNIAIRPAGASLSTTHYIAFGEPVGGNSMVHITSGITLATTDVITVFSTNGTSSFSAFGSEIS